MSLSFSSSHHFPFLSELSPENQGAAEKAHAELDARRKKAAEASDRKGGVDRGDVAPADPDALGAARARELRQLMQHERRAFRDLRQPPGGLKLDIAQAERARRAKADQLLRKFGVNPEQFTKIGTEARDAVRDVLGEPGGKVVPGHYLPANLKEWEKLSPQNKRPLPWGSVLPWDDPNDPHRWFVYRPPFFGFDWSSLLWGKGGCRVSHDHVLDPRGGLCGNDVHMDDNDAGSVDGGWAEVETLIAFGFEPPQAGLLEVLIDAQCAIGAHDIDTEDEWGWSDSTTHHRNYLILRVLHPNSPESTLGLMDEWTYSTASDEHFRKENLIRGQHYYAQLLSSGPVPGGQSVVIEIGTRTHDVALINDVEVHNSSIFHWFISSVQVRVAP